ncbi:MAG: PIN domain-containing protein [Bacteroidota bacterium]
MRIVIDTNILFSALLSRKSTLGNMILLSGSRVTFYGGNHLRDEIQRNWEKLRKMSGLSDKELNDSFFVLSKKVSFIEEELIPLEIWLKAEKLTRGIDIDDAPFIALAEYLSAFLWTGDKVLYNGLKNRNYKKIVNTKDLQRLLSHRHS